jgi:hypothetical protein
MLDGGVTREHDERDVAPFGAQQLEKLEPGQPRHPVIGNDEVDVAARERTERFRHACRTDGGVTQALECVAEDEPDRGLVVDVEDVCHLSTAKLAQTRADTQVQMGRDGEVS